MARIRSIKPEFWRDEKIAGLKNRLSALFFIGLWNVADDEGKFPLSPKQLSLELPIFRVKEVKIYLSHLSHSGLTRESLCGQWGLIVGWHHQKIDRPRLPIVKNEDIQWFNESDSSKPRDSSSIIRRKDRIGEDRIGYTTTTIADEIKQAFEEWNTTLKRFGIPEKNISPSDERTLSQAIKSLGLARVVNAIIGKRYEPASANYDPRKTLSLEYCLSRNSSTGKSNHERLENLALMAVAEYDAKHGETAE